MYNSHRLLLHGRAVSFSFSVNRSSPMAQRGGRTDRRVSVTENYFCAWKAWLAMENNYEGVTNGVRTNERRSEDRGVKLAIARRRVCGGRHAGAGLRPFTSLSKHKFNIFIQDMRIGERERERERPWAPLTRARTGNGDWGGFHRCGVAVSARGSQRGRFRRSYFLSPTRGLEQFLLPTC